jgi:Rieske Fe-S protein
MQEVQMESEVPESGLSRRKVLVAGTGTVLGASLLAACGGSDSGSSDSAGTPAGGSSSSGGGSGGGGALAKVADVPVGGAVSATGPDGKPVIVAQPSDGEIVAFSAICTHQGCTVAPADKILKCPCHGSTYDLATGKNTGGPAPRPLTEIAVKVEGGQVVEA